MAVLARLELVKSWWTRMWVAILCGAWERLPLVCASACVSVCACAKRHVPCHRCVLQCVAVCCSVFLFSLLPPTSEWQGTCRFTHTHTHARTHTLPHTHTHTHTHSGREAWESLSHTHTHTHSQWLSSDSFLTSVWVCECVGGWVWFKGHFDCHCTCLRGMGGCEYVCEVAVCVPRHICVDLNMCVTTHPICGFEYVWIWMDGFEYVCGGEYVCTDEIWCMSHVNSLLQRVAVWIYICWCVDVNMCV